MSDDFDIIVTQQDIDEGTQFYCLCHGWHTLEKLEDFCPETYALSDGKKEK